MKRNMMSIAPVTSPTSSNKPPPPPPPPSMVEEGSAKAAESLKVGQLIGQFEAASSDPSPPVSEHNKMEARDLSCWWRRTRLHVALLGLSIAAVNCYAQATFCMAIVEMVLPADYQMTGSRMSAATSANANVDLPNDGSCPIEPKYRDYYDHWRFPLTSARDPQPPVSITTNASTSPVARLGSISNLVATISQPVDVSDRFDWDAGQQGLLLGAFAFGTAPLQIVGGRLAEIYGSKWVLLTGCIGTALTNLAMPHIARFSFLLLLVNRVLMGVAQAGMEPGLMCLLADWLTPQEAGFFISMLLFAICVGFFLGSLCSSLILGLGYGWPLAYYVSGGLNLAVGLVWCLYADSWPHASKYIGQRELNYIKREQRRLQPTQAAHLDHNSIHPTASGQHGTIAMACKQPLDEPQMQQKLVEDPMRAPWLNILSTRSVWAFIVCKISVRWCADVLSNELPTYLANVLHLSIKINGLFNSISTALFMISSFLTGWLVNGLFILDESKNQKDSNSLVTNTNSTIGVKSLSSAGMTRVRKVFQSFASFGSALCIVLMTHFDCDIAFSMSMLLILSCCLVMGTGGELQIPYDMTSRYPGTLHGMACTLSVSGWLAPPLIGLVLGDQPSSRQRWSIVWYSTAAITLVGGLAFVLFADSSPRDFDSKPQQKHKHRKLLKATSEASQEADHLAASKSRKQSEVSLCPLVAPDRGGYVNGALNSSSCESSPKARHLAAAAATTTASNCERATGDAQLESPAGMRAATVETMAVAASGALIDDAERQMILIEEESRGCQTTIISEGAIGQLREPIVLDAANAPVGGRGTPPPPPGPTGDLRSNKAASAAAAQYHDQTITHL